MSGTYTNRKIEIFIFCLIKLIIAYFSVPIICLAKEKVEYDISKNKIVYCNEKFCSDVELSDSLKENIKQDYDLLFFENFGNNLYILATLSNSNAPNTCYISYQIENNKVSSKPVNILPDNKMLCDYHIINNKLLNRYKDGAKWFEAAYELLDNNYHLIAIDECLGCDVVIRTSYLNGDSYRYWVTNEDNFDERKPILIKIKSQKSFFYSKPNKNNLTNKYLISGDQAEIIETKDNFIKIRYYNSSKGAITGWILKNTIEKNKMIE